MAIKCTWERWQNIYKDIGGLLETRRTSGSGGDKPGSTSNKPGSADDMAGSAGEKHGSTWECRRQAWEHLK